MADPIIFKDARPTKESDQPKKERLIETVKKGFFLNGHLIAEGTPYTVEEPKE